MDELLRDIFHQEFLYSDKPTTPEYQKQYRLVSTYHDKVEEALGSDFSEQLWYAHNQLSELELEGAFLFGLHLARAVMLSNQNPHLYPYPHTVVI